MRIAGYSCVELAKTIATNAHEGQKRWGGEPYIVHPEAVAKTVAGYGWEHESVAWLHDVVEDTPLTLGYLLDAGIPYEVVRAVEFLTHREEQTYLAYILELRKHEMVRRIKLADIECNLNDSKDRKNKNSVRDKWMLAAHILSV
jgi:(p)ppGpp synthase/HD superfamily hydrolase